jgi:hypothetical protein
VIREALAKSGLHSGDLVSGVTNQRKHWSGTAGRVNLFNAIVW